MKPILSFCTVVLVILGCQTAEQQKQQALLKGNKALAEGHDYSAERYYIKALSVDSAYLPAWLNLAKLHHDHGDYLQAVEAYNNAATYHPQQAQVYLRRAMSLQALGQLRLAEGDLDTHLDLNATAAGYMALGLLRNEQGRHQEALSQLARAHQLDSLNGEVLLNAAAVAYYLQQLDTAEQLVRRGLRLMPKEPNGLNTLALIKGDKGFPNEALITLDTLVANDRRNALLHNNKGYLHLLAGELEAAAESLDFAGAVLPSSPWVLRNRGWLAHLQGADSLATARLHQAWQKEPTIPHLAAWLSTAVDSLAVRAPDRAPCQPVQADTVVHPKLLELCGTR